MSLKLKYGSYTFSIMPTFNPRETTKFDEANNRKGVEIEWPTEGYLKADGPDDLNDQLNLLKVALAKDSQDLKLTKSDNTVLQEVLASTCIKGPKCDSFEIIEPREGLYSTNIQFRVSFSAFKTVSAGSILRHDFSTLYEADRFGFLRMTRTGTVQTRPGASKNTAKKLDPKKIPKTDIFILDSSTFNVNEDDSETKYSFIYVELRKKLPLQVQNGGYTISESLDVTGQLMKTVISGQFQASNVKFAKEAALSLKPKDDLIEERIEINEFEGTCNFSFITESLIGDSNIISRSERISIEKPTNRKIFHPLVSQGQIPVEQVLGKTTWRATQSGEAVGRNGYPGQPPPVSGWDDLIIENRIEYESPELVHGTYKNFKTRWFYSFESSRDFGEAKPR